MGAGFMYFVDEVIAPQAPAVFGPKRLDTEALKRDLPRVSQKLSAGFSQVAQQTRVPNLADLFSKINVAGIGARREPFSFEWTSGQGLGNCPVGPHCFFLRREQDAENQVLQNMVTDLQQQAIQGAKWNALAEGARHLLAWVAARDESVSSDGDIVAIGRWRTRFSRLE